MAHVAQKNAFAAKRSVVLDGAQLAQVLTHTT